MFQNLSKIEYMKKSLMNVLCWSWASLSLNTRYKINFYTMARETHDAVMHVSEMQHIYSYFWVLEKLNIESFSLLAKFLDEGLRIIYTRWFISVWICAILFCVWYKEEDIKCILITLTFEIHRVKLFPMKTFQV